MQTLEQWRNEHTRILALFHNEQKNRRKTLVNLKKQKEQLHLLQKAHSIIKLAGMQTQEQLQFHISELTSMALKTVFEDPYVVKLEFIERRNKSECDIVFHKEDNPEQTMHPTDSSGFGAVDIASFALRLAIWGIKENKTRNTIILDEPFKFLDKPRQEKASEMLSTLSDKLQLQFIIVTHEEAILEKVDRMFRVTKKGKKSKIIQI